MNPSTLRYRVAIGALAFVVLAARPAMAQPAAAPTPYLPEAQRGEAAAIAAQAPGKRDRTRILNLLPLTLSGSFAQYVLAQRAVLPSVDALLGSIDANRLNKMIDSAPGAGGTSLVSRVAAPAVLGTAVEYGTILQEHTGTATALRANALGMARLLFGTEQYQYCPEIARAACPAQARFLRRVSASVSFGAQSETELTGSETVDALLGDDYRVSSWSARLDLTPSNNLDDPGYVDRWRTAIDALRKDPTSADLVTSLGGLFAPYFAADGSIYQEWMDQTVQLLDKTPEGQFVDLLERRVRSLVARLEAEDPEFAGRMAEVIRAYERYFDVRERLLREAHAHKSSLEFVNQRPLSQPHYSQLRYIYSHQPTAAAAVLTVNVAVGAYDSKPAAGGQFRDVQLAAQVDRRLGEVAGLGAPSLTFAVYYQWLKEDALIKLGDSGVLPGTAIRLPDGAASLLATKGHIGAVQAKLTFSLGEAVRVPLSVTWATRKELVDESVARGQIGLTFDLDQLLH